jgi:raffinose/stachyose/melibiose transport system substrate-binding protein
MTSRPSSTFRRLSPAALAALVAAVPVTAGPAAAQSSGAKVSITIADGWGDTPAVAKAFQAVVNNFEKAYPNVTVNLETEGSNSYNESINLKAASANPPDVFMLSTAGYGPGFYDLAKAGDLQPLDKDVKAYGWDERYSKTALQVFRLNVKTGQWGTGSLYGLPEQNTVIGVFYNKKILKSLGWSSPPTSFAQFEKTLSAAKAKGITPIAATKDAYVHDEVALWDAFAPSAASVNNWVYGISGSFSGAANIKALDTLAAWQNAGYLQAGSEGIAYETAVNSLTGGQALYFFAGPWLDSTVQSALGKNGGFFELPSVSKMSPVGGGPSSPLVISSKSKYQEVDADFLNFFSSVKESAFLVASGWGPTGANVPATAAPASSLDAVVLKVLGRVEAPNGPGTTPYINWASPAINNDIYSGLEELIGGTVTPQKYAAAIQKDWVQFKSQRH